ncbi:short-chain dehydrogenase/reductase [Gymnopus androsaceus JB14]|uniref:Short-chain dehydrogenase/reductase n=1 Tax=Gymnopus androsaceus JB14 TaxID=1447944 RepID=A0A6A4HPU0_9AGAR|nr:short-chain dehydrogenase/reductase [Gymnopus androsaceus JB14]
MSLSKVTPTYHKDTYPSISPTKPSLTQAGKTVLITGGGGGIGFEIARSFAKASASKIIIINRRAGLLDEALAKLRQEFRGDTTEFIAHQADMASDSSVTSLWEFLHSQNILVHVLILNAANVHPMAPDTLSMDKTELMEAFGTNVGGNFLMSANFVKQPLRPKGLKLYLINVSTGNIHTHPLPNQTPYSTSKAAFTALMGRIADERPVDDVQIISFNPGAHYTEAAAAVFDRNYYNWDEFALPADFSVWAASPEASWLHGRFVWAHWDVDELKADREILRRLKEENGYLKVGVQGLNAFTVEAIRA